MTIPVIIDCDPGTDDALALMLAFAAPELDVQLVTTVGGNVGVEQALANACAIVGLSGAAVPVMGGAGRPLLGSFPPPPPGNGLANVALPAGPPAAPGLAPDAIRATLRAAAEPMTLIAIGPATNIALALLTEPVLVPKVERFVFMSGACGEGNVTPAAEFNAFCDPEALAAVMSFERPAVFATLEVTAQALATPDRLAELRAAGSGRAMQTACEIQAGVPPSRRLGGRGAALHDPCAIAWLVRPQLFTTRPARVSVDCGWGPSRGRTNFDRFCSPGTTNATLLEELDVEGFFCLLGAHLAALP